MDEDRKEKEEIMGRRRLLYSLVVVVICLARRSLLEIKRVVKCKLVNFVLKRD